MPPFQDLPPQNSSVAPQSSAIPFSLAPEVQQQSSGYPITQGPKGRDVDPVPAKRRLLGLEKKKEDSEASRMDNSSTAQVPSSAIKGSSADLRAHPQPIPISPRHPYQASSLAAASSPMRASSPRLHSPASSEIFERSVQEPIPLSNLQDERSPAHIPTHVLTEDHIPAALEASVEAITSNNLTPDQVEIVTSYAHQPAGEKVLDVSSSHTDLASLHSPPLRHLSSDASETHATLGQIHEDEGASTYGQLDPNDVRRLSFISFADVVHTEHQQQAASNLESKENLQTLPSPPGSFPQDATMRSSTTLSSPTSPQGSFSAGLTTPPHHAAGPTAGGLASLLPAQHVTQHGELNIETMRQAVRKTASGDLSGIRNVVNGGLSPVSSHEEGVGRM
ncbi:hypothetical protein LTR62_001976 [Meristemomyces frigidus]|uniref:Uncharacterized protein n=1 Tax=Meristemomyces frigidus TaxID=1508187 RepID=A0AAN7T7I9_9PEZI|nr:hypothetical protein LTR62_001976 [Meristemomyces frigidus]